MKTFKLAKEEQKLLDSVEAGEWVQVENFEEEKKLAMEAARNTMKKTKNINIRITELVLAKLKAKAQEEGIPYQTLVSSILHKYVNNTKLL